eukprot:2378868-Rhodomonas_salina.1
MPQRTPPQSGQGCGSESGGAQERRWSWTVGRPVGPPLCSGHRGVRPSPGQCTRGWLTCRSPPPGT